MSKILVVDDSAVARHALAGILGSNENFVVTTAVDGVNALEEIRRQEPDVVVTDLMMPNMNGFELAAELRRSYPHIPAVLVTSEGSEEIAARALREGAASYVPKAALERELLSTVNRIVELAQQERTRMAVLNTMTAAELTFVLDNDPSLIPSLIQHLQDCMRQLCSIPAADLLRISVALEEALDHALYHGNLEISLQLRDQPGNAFYELAAERREQEPYCHRKIHVLASLSEGTTKFVVRDEGPGLDAATLPDPADSSNLDKLSGRGVVLMMTFLDDVSFNESGNEVTLLKRVGE